MSEFRHPLEPLSAEEIAATSAILTRERSLSRDAVRFVCIELHEPAKQVVLSLTEGQSVDRETFVVLHDRRNRTTIEAIVSLTRGKIRSWREVHGVQPPFTDGELAQCAALVCADSRFEAAMLRRGLDLSTVAMDLWAAGNTGPQDNPTEGRLMRPLFHVQLGKNDNRYARPVEGLVVLIDLDRMEVLDFTDHGVVPLPERSGNYIPELVIGQIEGSPDNFPALDRMRQDLRSIEITQPEGPSFTVDDHAVSWQKWRLRIGYTPREGLVLYQVGYEDGGRVRPILYRASLSELYVSYGDPNPMHRIKNVFDEGEWGLGPMLNSLVRGCDCLGDIRYFDVVINDADGNPRTLSNAICLHEEDVGVAWKHTHGSSPGHMETRRNRRLVVSCFVTVNNYDYGLFWYFYLDGTIEFEAKLTGIVSTGAFSPGDPPLAYGTVVAPGLYAPNHQHFFNVRLDMSVDGERNSVYEVDSVALSPGPDNPGANAWVTRPTLLARESEAQRVVDPLVGRCWTVVNRSGRNELGQPVGYKLAPGDNILPLAGKGSQTHRRAGFAYKHLWVTAYDPAERYAAGDYPRQQPDDTGLPVFVQADRPLDDADVVLWYTFGAHHVVRPEDWPVMPVSCIGFHLKPAGFFNGNPALDLPRQPTHGG
ncbi:MAG: primary-amine oxidase [Pseudonocardiaceae bacterium]